MTRLRAFLERKLAIYLRRRGWVVFWLDIEQRRCSPQVCWLAMHEIERRQDEERRAAVADVRRQIKD